MNSPSCGFHQLVEIRMPSCTGLSDSNGGVDVPYNTFVTISGKGFGQCGPVISGLRSNIMCTKVEPYIQEALLCFCFVQYFIKEGSQCGKTDFNLVPLPLSRVPTAAIS